MRCFCVTGPLWGESIGHRWISLTKSSGAGLWCFLWSAPEQTAGQTTETPISWGAIAFIMTSLWWSSFGNVVMDISICFVRSYCCQHTYKFMAMDISFSMPMHAVAMIEMQVALTHCPQFLVYNVVLRNFHKITFPVNISMQTPFYIF